MMLLLQKENEINTDTKEIEEFPNAEILAGYLSSLDKDDLWLYGIFEWDGDEIVEDWLRADEWLEDFLKLFDGELYQVGTRVCLPRYFKTRKNQKRLCVIDSFHPGRGRKYVILRGITHHGVSKSMQQVVYFAIDNLLQLEYCSLY